MKTFLLKIKTNSGLPTRNTKVTLFYEDVDGFVETKPTNEEGVAEFELFKNLFGMGETLSVKSVHVDGKKVKEDFNPLEEDSLVLPS